MSNQCLGLGAPGRNTTGGTDIPHVVKRSGAKFREEFILRPDRVQMAPVNVISVAVVASDPLTRDGALARLSSHRELDVRAWQAGCETSVLLVLATTITAPLLAGGPAGARSRTCRRMAPVTRRNWSSSPTNSPLNKFSG